MRVPGLKGMDWKEFSEAYCETQEQTPEGLLEVLKWQKKRYDPNGWMLLECQMLDSSYLGNRTILAYGPHNTFKEPTRMPIALNGLASHTSSVIGILKVEALP